MYRIGGPILFDNTLIPAKNKPPAFQGFHNLKADIRRMLVLAILAVSLIAGAALQAQTITVTSPNTPVDWHYGNHNITWTSSGLTGNVKIDLLRHDAFFQTISTNAPNTGSYTWTTDNNTLQYSGDFKIRITSIDLPAITDDSDNSFCLDGYEYSVTVQLSSAVQKSPAKITISWLKYAVTPSAINIYRRTPSLTSSSWGVPVKTITSPTINDTSYEDTDVVPGIAYEYKVLRGSAMGYICAGIDLTMVENRGTVILLVDNTMSAPLATELARMKQDLIGDGWNVIRHDVDRKKITDAGWKEAVVATKALIKADYDADPANVKAVCIIGHVPVPYSGQIAPDGHYPDHVGAWPADIYYADMDGTWTDTSVNYVQAGDTAQHNIPGDGKFDQSSTPGDGLVELAVGRIDLSNMPAFSKNETELLRQYLNKDHNFRYKILTAQPRAMVDDNFDSYAPTGSITSYSALLGGENVFQKDWFTTLSTEDYLFADGSGGGSLTSAGGIGNTTDFATKGAKAIFTGLFGSYFGDWDHSNNFLRAPLCTDYGLTCFWSARPHWFLHPMGAGETMGYCVQLSQSDSGASYQGGYGTRMVHMALMGDPTLRLHVVNPVRNLVTSTGYGMVDISWGAPYDTNIVGYHVYRSTSTSTLGPFTRITGVAVDASHPDGAPIAATTFRDSTVTIGTIYTYMVRAVKNESGFIAGGANYFNLSQGAYVTTGVEIDPSKHALYGMGANNFGQLGDGTTFDRLSPVPVGTFTAVAVSAGGFSHSLFLRDDGSLWAMGWNAYGQLGNGGTTDQISPVQIVSSGVKAVSASSYHSLFLKTDGSLWAMGYNHYGQLGDGTVKDILTPKKIVSSNVTAISASSYNSLFLKTDGSLWAMGWNGYGQLGIPDTVNNQTTPIKIVDSGVTAISSGQGYTLFIKSDGSLWGMGSSGNGQLGLGTTDLLIPTEIVPFDGVNTVTAVSAGNHSLFLKSDGSLWGMGYNDYGQLGLGNTIAQSSPQKIVNSGVAAISAAGGEGRNSLFLRGDGSVWAMGYNANGQLGDGTTTDRHTPVQVVASDVTAISAADHSLFLRNNLNLFVVTFLEGVNGTVSGTKLQKVAQGTNSVSVTAVPGIGYHFVNWTGTGSFPGSTSNPLVLSNVQEAVTITANFAPTVTDVQIATDLSSLNINEGGTGTIQVKLTAPPPANKTVTVSRTAGDTGITVSSGAILTFTTANWNSYQSVTISAAEDADTINDSATITLSSAGSNDKTVAVTGIDNDTTITVNNNGYGTTSPSGAIIATKGSAIPISVTSESTGYHFVNWTVMGGSAAFAEANSPTTTVAASADAAIRANFALNNVQITTDLTSVSVNEGSTNTFQVKLTMQPTVSRTVSVARYSGDIDIKVSSGASLTFTTSNWGTYQAVTLATAEDADNINGTTIIRCSSSGMSNKDIAATEIDDDYALTANAVNGYISKSPSMALYENGTVVQLTAVPVAGWHFVNWTGDLSGTQNPSNITMGSNKNITAIFEENIFQIVLDKTSLTVNEGGTSTFNVKLSTQPNATTIVNVSRSSGSSNISVVSGATLTFTSSNWGVYQSVTLASAEDDLDNYNDMSTISVSASGLTTQTLDATQADDDYTLDITALNGTVTKNPDRTLYDKDVTVTLTAAPIANYRFVNWTGDLTGTDNPAILSFSANRIVTANFAHATADLNMAVLGNGNTAPGIGTHTVDTATVTNISASPEPGYFFINWSLNGNGTISNPNSADTTVMLTGNSTVTAKFIAGSMTELTNNTPETVAGFKGKISNYKITVPPGKTLLHATTSGGIGDCDLYMKFNDYPTVNDYYMKSTNSGNEEDIKIYNPSAGTWYVNLYGYDDFSDVVLNVTLDDAVPGKPLNLAASQGTYPEKIVLTWDPVSGATGYEIYRSHVNDIELASKLNPADVTETTFSDLFQNTLADYRYYYWVRAVNAAGVGGFSSPAYGRNTAAGTGIIDLANGTAVTLISGTAGSVKTYRITVLDSLQTLLEVSISGGTGDCDIDVVKPDGAVSRSIRGSNNELVQIKSPVNGSWLINLYGQTDYSKLTLLAKYGKAAPLTPAGLAASDGHFEDRILLNWTGSAGATSYEVFRNTTKIAPLPGDRIAEVGDNTYEDRDVDPEHTYYYFVTAKNAAGTSKPSAGNSGFLMKAPVNPPAAPLASDGTYFDRIRVSWTKMEGATSYMVFRTEAAAPAPDPLADTAIGETSALFLDDFGDDIVPQIGGIMKNYYYWIATKNQSGTSPISKSNNGYLSNKGPATVTASNGMYSNKITVTWSTVAGAVSYDVYRYTDKSLSPITNDAKFEKINVTSYDDTTAVLGTQYYYRVKAKYATGVTYEYDSEFSPSVLGLASGSNTPTAEGLDNGETSGLVVNIQKGNGPYFSVNVPMGITRLVAILSGTGTDPANDCDLFAKFANYPTKTSYGAKGVETAQNETLTISNPASGIWYFLLYAASDYSNVALKVNCYAVADIVITKWPSNDLAVPFTTTFKGQVVDESGTGIPNIVLQVRNPITGMISWLPAKTDASGFFNYSTLINTEGEHTFDFFFTEMPDSAKGTASHTVATRKGCLESNKFFDFSAYLPATPIAVPLQADIIGIQTFLDIRNGWAEGFIDTKYEDMWINDTIVASSTDSSLLGKLDEGLYMFFYGVEGAGAGNDTTAKSALSAVPFVVHVDSLKLSTVLSNLNDLGIIDNTQKDAILIGKKIGVVAVAAHSNPGEGVLAGDKNISLLAREQLEVLANLADGTASENLLAPEGNKYSDVITKKLSVDLNGGMKKLNVKTSAFVK